MAEKKRKPLWRDRRLYVGCVAFGLVLGATCPLWPERTRVVCVTLSQGLKGLGLQQLGLPASSAPDAGS